MGSGEHQAVADRRRTRSSSAAPTSTSSGASPTSRKRRPSSVRESDKRGKLVEYLLDHPDYAKNFANHWTVTLVGRKRQERMVDRAALTAWLRRQFTENRPWNEMAYDLITAKGSNKENGAVNFTLSHLEFGAVPLTSITTRVFLGQQIQCTQCHDHPSNDWKQADFWGINAFFKGIKRRRSRRPTPPAPRSTTTPS